MADAEHPLDALVAVMAQLRSEDGCPWDREQTHRSLLRYLIEESYEVVDAVESGSMDELCDELGDLLLQVVFHSQLAREVGAFTIDDVIRSITDKMIRRHPHVFGDAHAESASDVIANWEAIKRSERGDDPQGDPQASDSPQHARSQLAGISRHLPALLYADEVSRRAAKVGFDWPDIDGVFAKLHEEIDELRQAYAQLQAQPVDTSTPPHPSSVDAAQQRVEEEWGDLLFTLVNLARHMHVQPELAARRAAKKFAQRFQAVEQVAAAEGVALDQLSLTELDELWERAKAGQSPKDA